MLNYPISVFVDTNVFDKCKYHLGPNGVLQMLKTLNKNGKVKLYISNIVLGETDRHIRSLADNTYKVLESAQKEARKIISPTLLEGTAIESYFSFPTADGIKEAAIRKFQKYINDMNTVVLDNSGVDLEQVVRDYFDGNPPFELKEKKKNEFPDAIMISKLKASFSKTNPIWIVSEDKGFRKSFQGLDGFNCVSILNELFDMINKQDRQFIYDEVQRLFINVDFLDKLKDDIKFEIEDVGVDINGVDCDRSGYCEGFEYNEIIIEDISEFEIELSSIDEIDDEIVVVSVLCNAEFKAYCSFDDYENSIWDSEEKEYLFLERGEVEEVHNAKFECVLRLNANNESSDLKLQLEKILHDIELDQYTRISREFVEPEDPRLMAEAEMMDALEEYHNH